MTLRRLAVRLWVPVFRAARLRRCDGDVAVNVRSHENRKMRATIGTSRLPHIGRSASAKTAGMIGDRAITAYQCRLATFRHAFSFHLKSLSFCNFGRYPQTSPHSVTSLRYQPRFRTVLGVGCHRRSKRELIFWQIHKFIRHYRFSCMTRLFHESCKPCTCYPRYFSHDA